MENFSDKDRLIASVRLLRVEDVMLMTGFRSREQIYRLVRSGELAPPVKIGRRASAWKTCDVVAFIDTRVTDPLARPINRLPST